MTKEYEAMLNIKAIVRKWQNLDISDYQALLKVAQIIARQEWTEKH